MQLFEFLILAAVVLIIAALFVPNDFAAPWTTWNSLKRFVAKHYLTTFILIGGALFVWVAYTYIVRLWPVLSSLLDDMGTSDATSDRAATRNIALAIAAFAGMLAVLATVPFRLVRAWIAERTAKVAESNLTTDLINKAVEGLGAEKTVSRIGRPVTVLDEPYGAHTDIQWQGGPAPAGLRPEFGDWQTFNVTEPNLEVRIGAIYALERIARENLEEHVRVMEVLCAYIRENAKASDAKDHDLGDWPDSPGAPTSLNLKDRKALLSKRQTDMHAWLNALERPRSDIQTALEVIGRRNPDQIATEQARESRDGRPYRLDLRGTNLRNSDMAQLNFDKTRLHGSKMEWANLRLTQMEGADLREARLEGSDLREARMEGANFFRAQMERANLRLTQMEGANLGGAQMQGAVLNEVQMDGADLRGARMQGAVLFEAQMVGANLFAAQLEGGRLIGAQMHGAELSGAQMQWAVLSGVDLSRARMEWADLRRADLRSSEWAGCYIVARAHFADLRGAKGLTQDQLDCMIGNEQTLLPETLADGSVPSIPSRWPAPGPKILEPMIKGLSGGSEDRANQLRAQFLCPEGEQPQHTGTPLALDAPYPEGHPLAKRDD